MHEVMRKLMVKILDKEEPHIYIQLPIDDERGENNTISKSIDVTSELNLTCEQTVRFDLDEDGNLLSIEIF
ncbi:hypothetical protein ABS767_16955 [Sphingomonas sp. ST-64]|uniref:Uncharacterized protein n=1 Tax=Sphingomonas plantiphila TaxID=3163295 RepID=A0ABW8YR99_9SPHN